MKADKVLYWLDMGCYPGHTVFVRGFSFDQVRNLMRRKKANDWLDAFNFAVLNQSEKGCWANKTTMENKKTGEVKHYFFIYVHTFSFLDYDYVKLAHEVLHICQFYLPDILDRNKEHEAECYLHTHLMQQCLKIMRG